MVFPAHAGMIRTTKATSSTRSGVPRSRGDDPAIGPPPAIEGLCSPLTRG